MPKFFQKSSQNIIISKQNFFRIFGIFPACFGYFWLSVAANKKHLELQKFC